MTGVLMKSEEKPRIFYASSSMYTNIHSVQSYLRMMASKDCVIRALILIKQEFYDKR